MQRAELLSNMLCSITTLIKQLGFALKLSEVKSISMTLWKKRDRMATQTTVITTQLVLTLFSLLSSVLYMTVSAYLCWLLSRP